MCLARPGINLLDHLKRVKEIGLGVYSQKSHLGFSIPKKDIKTALSNMLFYHDIGKSTIFFQDYLRASVNGVEYTGDSKLKHHSLISAIYASFKTYKELNNFASVNLLPIIVFLAVRKHHGDFDDVKDMLSITSPMWRKLEIQWNNLRFDCVNEVNKFNFNEAKNYISDLLFDIEDIDSSIENYLFLNLFFSILTYADKNEAKFGKQIKFAELPNGFSNWVDRYKAIEFSQLNLSEPLNYLRNESYKLCAENAIKEGNKSNIFTINVPTGGGKTLTGLNVALKILENDNDMKKIIYALPFTSIVEQTYEVISDVVKYNRADPMDYITKHHHLAEAEIKNNEDSYTEETAQFLIENWDKPILVTTFWQFFNTLISNKNRLTRKFHNLANSIIILDEIQTMPMEYWDVISKMLEKMATVLNSKIIVMTATLPLIFSEETISPLIDKNKIKEYYGKVSRYEIKYIHDMQPITIDDLFGIAIDKIIAESEKDFLFVFNTIQSSLDFYKKLKSVSKSNLIYLSGNIIPKDRLERIEKIKHSPGRKIVVSTQLVEAGVDIDLDIVFRDFAPFDSIIQTAGRCNRNGKDETGKIYLFTLLDEKNSKKYCNYIYKPLSLKITDELLKEAGSIKEHNLLDVLKIYYIKTKKEKSNNISRKIISDIAELNYDSISKEFELIEKAPNILVFVEKDDEASKILNQFRELLESNKIDRRNKFFKIKKSFYNYVLSVRINKKTADLLDGIEEVGNFKLITKDMIEGNNFYNNDMGLNFEFENFI